MSYHLSTSSFVFVAQVLIHLVTRTIVVVLNIDIGTYHTMMGGRYGIPSTYLKFEKIPELRDK